MGLQYPYSDPIGLGDDTRYRHTNRRFCDFGDSEHRLLGGVWGSGIWDRASLWVGLAVIGWAGCLVDSESVLDG